MRWLRSTAEIESSWTQESRRIACSTSLVVPVREREAYPWAAIVRRRRAVSEMVRIRTVSLQVRTGRGRRTLPPAGRGATYGVFVATCTRRVPEMPASDGSPLRYALTKNCTLYPVLSGKLEVGLTA